MKLHAPLLVFGHLPPTAGVAAETVQAAVELSAAFRVTIVISDTAPPPTIFEASAAVTVIRMRDLKANRAAYKLHRRLYVLDDSYLSLFALELYAEAPGIVWAPSGNISRLLRNHFGSQPNWPQNYAAWLVHQLGVEGEIIAHGLVHHKRLPEQLLQELPPLGETPIAPSDAAAILSPSDIHTPPNLVCYGPPPSTTYTQNCRTELGLDNNTIFVVATDWGAAQQAGETLGTLKVSITEKLRFVFIDQTEENLFTLTAAADIILVTTESNTCPPLAAAAIAQAKAMITCSQPWAATLPTNCSINTLHSEALHQITAGISALASDKALRAWYSENLQLFAEKSAVPNGMKLLIERLQTKQSPLVLKPTPVTRSSTKSAAGGNHLSLAPGGPRSVALIGAVPPRPLLQKLMPEIDWATSPRFASPELATILCGEAPHFAANKLALLGYESPLIVNKTSPHNGGGQRWADIQQDLKATSEALSFGCSVEGAISADTLISTQNDTDYELSLVFRENESTKILAHFEEDCGLFWNLDPVRHEIDCLLVAGLTGKYQINLKTNGYALLVADADQTTVVRPEQPAQLTSKNQGVLSFTLVSLDNINLTPQAHDILTKTLADCDLSLKWLNNG